MLDLGRYYNYFLPLQDLIIFELEGLEVSNTSSTKNLQLFG